MDRECTCGGHIGGLSTSEENENVYKDLGVCIDCGKNYILKDGKFKYISKAEFRRITGIRKNYMSEMLLKYGR
jgi:hypothetical protein